MDNILDHVVVKGQRYDIVSPTAFGDYIETIGSACINPDGYAKGSTFLARLGNEQFYYEATAAITQGSAILEGTNCKKTTVTGREAELTSEIETLGETVDSLNEALANEVSARATLGAHNLLSEKFASQVGSHYILSVDDYGICTITTDGTTPTEMFTPTIYTSISFPYDVILSGCPSGGGGGTYQLDANGGSYEDTGNGVLIPANITITQIRIRIAAGYVPNPSLVIKPMITLPIDPSTTYTPYAMTNRELTEFANGLVVEAITSNSITVAANSNATVYAPITKSNYTPLGIMGIISFSSELTIYEWGIGNTKTQAFAGIKNRGSDSVKGALTFYILYKKS